MSGELRLELEKPVYGGDCLARADGKAVFVPLALPGETVSARLVEEKRSFAKAELTAVLAPSPERVETRCPYFGACGGCHYQHAAYPAQIAIKTQILRETLARAGVAIPEQIAVLSGEPWGYRNRIRLAVAEDGRIGYRGRRSHAIVPVAECPIAAPLLMETARGFEAFLAAEPSPVRVTEIELFTNAVQSEQLLTVFCETAPAASPEPWLRGLLSFLPQVTGARLQLADGGIHPRVLASSGSSALTYSVAGLDYHVNHGSFFQVNRFLVDDFVKLVAGEREGKLAWDLYAGVGLFARQLALRFQQVLAVEPAQASFAGLKRNLEGSAGTAVGSTTLDFLRRNRAQREPRPDLIVLDPPRAGLDPETTQFLNQIHAPEMIYVSCDPATLARDLKALTQERFELHSLTLVDMFPQTYHLETVARLLRR
jgi:23S rRNA (uracil1939-C5)-methyltransferase